MKQMIQNQVMWQEEEHLENEGQHAHKFRNLNEVLYTDNMLILKVNQISRINIVIPRTGPGQEPDPRGAAKYSRTPLEAFQLFFFDEMVENIVKFPNVEIISEQLIVTILELIFE